MIERVTKYMTQYNSMLGLGSDIAATYTSQGRFGIASAPPALGLLQDAMKVSTGDVTKVPNLLPYGKIPGVVNVTNFLAEQVDSALSD
jgi:hypothetical protein